MGRQEVMKQLKKYYTYNLFSECYIGKVSIISVFTDKEIKESFLKNDNIANYLEPFLLRCYKAKIELEIIEKEYLYKLARSNDSRQMLDLEFEYLELLSKVADYFEWLGVFSKARCYYDNYQMACNYIKQCKDLIRYMEIDPKDIYSTEIINEYKKALFEDNSREIIETKNIFIEMVLDSIESKNIDNLNHSMLLYSDKITELENLVPNKYNNALKECINEIYQINEDVSNNLKIMYNLFAGYSAISLEYLSRIREIVDLSLDDSIYIRIKKN